MQDTNAVKERRIIFKKARYLEREARPDPKKGLGLVQPNPDSHDAQLG